jgi:hypothetical protein
MKLSALTAKPQLIEVSIDDEDTMKEFGEPITFHTWDRQAMNNGNDPLPDYTTNELLAMFNKNKEQ